jgi:ribosomal protein S18 acetylase RimI-like enzyme
VSRPSPDTVVQLVVQLERDSPASDGEVEALLERIYVGEGFTDADVARTALRGEAVRSRGELLVARSGEGGLAGMVMVVSPTSAGRRLAQADEAEMHLLAVSPEHRGRGVGRALVDAAVSRARDSGFARMVLWTQPSMHAAHRVYAGAGFVRAPKRDFQRGQRLFLVMEKALRP